MAKSIRRCLATYSAAGPFGVEVLSVDYRNEAIIWRWSNENKEHSSKYKDIAGRLCFRVNRIWVPLDEGLRVNRL